MKRPGQEGNANDTHHAAAQPTGELQHLAGHVIGAGAHGAEELEHDGLQIPPGVSAELTQDDEAEGQQRHQ